MGESELSTSPPKSFTEYFELACPVYMAMGMTYEQFWDGDIWVAKAYREADAIRRRRKNEELWLEGVYMAEALSATVGNMFSKGNKHQYPSEPIPITAEEQKARREREEKAKMERMKAAFTAKALKMNAQMGGSAI